MRALRLFAFAQVVALALAASNVGCGADASSSGTKGGASADAIESACSSPLPAIALADQAWLVAHWTARSTKEVGIGADAEAFDGGGVREGDALHLTFASDGTYAEDVGGAGGAGASSGRVAIHRGRFVGQYVLVLTGDDGSCDVRTARAAKAVAADRAPVAEKPALEVLVNGAWVHYVAAREPGS